MKFKGKSAASLRRTKLRKGFWPDEDFWAGSKEKGWFSAPRTLSLVLSLMDFKVLSDNKAPSKVYLELLTRHVDGGFIEMKPAEEHAYAAGYLGKRGVRSWYERIQLLEKLGFIKTKPGGNRRFHYVLLVHPTVIVKRLYDEGKVPEDWWTTYMSLQAEIGAPTFEEREQVKTAASKVVQIGSRKKALQKQKPRKRRVK